MWGLLCQFMVDVIPKYEDALEQGKIPFKVLRNMNISLKKQRKE